MIIYIEKSKVLIVALASSTNLISTKLSSDYLQIIKCTVMEVKVASATLAFLKG